MSMREVDGARWADPDYYCNTYFYKRGDLWLGRNPHNFDFAVGYNDKRHFIVCAGSRSGKGRSFIVNNLALWQGSTVTYDPKGELPVILAARRGDGNEFCEGMGQDVYVLDPLNHSNVDDKYRGYFDPLCVLDPEDKDGELVTWAKRLANSLIEIPESGESAEWAKRAVRLIALIIMHVLTSPRFDEEEKTLMTVLRLLLEGDLELHGAIKKQFPDMDIGNPLTVLLEDMTENPACRGWLASDARNLLQQVKEVPKFFESIRGEATDKLDWFKSAGIEKSFIGWGDESRRFDPERLKTDPKGVSVFIVMPVEDLKTYSPWVQTVFTAIFAAMRKVKGDPASGHMVLTTMDEFSSLPYQDYIKSSMDNIAGSGMKIGIIIQNFGQLKKTYGDDMESFFTNAGLEIYFGKIGEIAEEYLKKQLGETTIIREAKSQNKSESTAEQKSKSVAFGDTISRGGSETETDSIAQGISRGKSWNWSKAVNWSNSKNWGSSNGRNMGHNYGPHIFFEGFEKSTNYGTNLSRNRGNAHTKGGSKTKGGGGSETISDTKTKSFAKGSTWQEGHSYTETETHGETETYTIGEGVAESFHKKPLLEPFEINAYLRSFEFENRDHPAYPGLALVRIQGEDPFFVRRSNYDQDPYFEKCFSEDPAYDFIPLEKQPLLGYQYTEEHIFPLKLPALMHENGFEGRTALRKYERFGNNETLFSFGPDGKLSNDVQAVFTGRVLSVASKSEREKDGSILTIKADIPINDNDQLAFKKIHFENYIADLKRKGITQTRIQKLEKHLEHSAAWQEKAKAHEELKEFEDSFDDWAIIKSTWPKFAIGTFILTVYFFGVGGACVAAFMVASGTTGMKCGIAQDKHREEYRRRKKEYDEKYGHIED